jgi:hypothetical protein
MPDYFEAIESIRLELNRIAKATERIADALESPEPRAVSFDLSSLIKCVDENTESLSVDLQRVADVIEGP